MRLADDAVVRQVDVRILVRLVGKVDALVVYLGLDLDVNFLRVVGVKEEAGDRPWRAR